MGVKCSKCNTTYDAAKNGNEVLQSKHLDCLKYAHENGCEWGKNTCIYAVLYGNLDYLKYAHENGCEFTCNYAVLYGKLDFLKYAHESGCEWSLMTCYYAAQNGKLDCLKYAHENGCEWDEEICVIAAENGNEVLQSKHLECLKYAHEKGCLWPKECYSKEVSIILIEERRRYYKANIIKRAWIKHRIVNRNKKIKKELIEKVFHPSRFQKLIEYYGVNNIDDNY